MEMERAHIPPIQRQVDLCAGLLGEAIVHTHGTETLTLVEDLRKQAALEKETGGEEEKKRLARLLENIEGLSPEQALWTARAFAIRLALINLCENAYRTSRLRETPEHRAPSLEGCLIFVLTAHPTEVRSASGILVGRRITSVLTAWFSRGADTPILADEKRELSALIRLLWQTGFHKDSPVTPAEEVDHIAGQFSDDIIREILKLRRRGADLRFRTWVGGDKDGHPGIDAAALHTSFRRTRQRFHRFFESCLDAIKEDFRQLWAEDVCHALKQVERALKDVRHVTVGDGIRVGTLRLAVESLCSYVQSLLGEVPLVLAEMSDLLNLFPGLVLPVELREESSIFRDLQRKKALGAIGKMLRKVKQIAEGGEIRHYVQGLIISMSCCPEDIEAAMDVVKRTVGMGKIPIIPLFERGEDLETAPGAVDSILSKYLPVLYKVPGQPQRYEIMLGYSDTAKRIGAFASRRRIFHAMHRLTAVCRRHHISPLFFHGAGGSVTRGGGSIEEQFAAWPAEARQIIKITIQGEMVERTLATPEILRRNTERLLVSAKKLTSRVTGTLKRTILDELSDISARAFERLAADKEFLRFMNRATLYPELWILHLGSRPSHRPGKQASADLGSLRAIPWVLCFTQARLLVPSWYGIGTAFEQISKDPQKLTALKDAFVADMAFKGFVKLMGFSLAKGDRAVFSLFADTLAAEPGLKEVKQRLLNEEKRVWSMVRTLSGEDDILWFRPWLTQSIRLRGSIIHPLSALEVTALRNRRREVQLPQNDELLRITIAGVATGMLTTG
jgi:phosphoenolpyruvate carboxylase